MYISDRSFGGRTRAIGTALRVALIAVIAATASGCIAVPARAQQSADLVNAIRVFFGAQPASYSLVLQSEAQRWAEHMATTCTLQHDPRPQAGIFSDYWWLGENIGYAAIHPKAVDSIHLGFVLSPPHLNALAKREVDSVGIGVADGCGRTWIAQRFADFADQ